MTTLRQLKRSINKFECDGSRDPCLAVQLGCTIWSMLYAPQLMLRCTNQTWRTKRLDLFKFYMRSIMFHWPKREMKSKTERKKNLKRMATRQQHRYHLLGKRIDEAKIFEMERTMADVAACAHIQRQPALTWNLKLIYELCIRAAIRHCEIAWQFWQQIQIYT